MRTLAMFVKSKQLGYAFFPTSDFRVSTSIPTSNLPHPTSHSARLGLLLYCPPLL
jgi:hypothetical protein